MRRIRIPLNWQFPKFKLLGLGGPQFGERVKWGKKPLKNPKNLGCEGSKSPIPLWGLWEKSSGKTLLNILANYGGARFGNPTARLI